MTLGGIRGRPDAVDRSSEVASRRWGRCRARSTARGGGGTGFNGIGIALRIAWADSGAEGADNLKLRLEGEGLIAGGFDEARARLQRAEFWEEELPWRAIMEDLPDYRLSKFQQVLPEWAERELVSEFLLDVEGARAFCGSRS